MSFHEKLPKEVGEQAAQVLNALRKQNTKDSTEVDEDSFYLAHGQEQRRKAPERAENWCWTHTSRLAEIH